MGRDPHRRQAVSARRPTAPRSTASTVASASGHQHHLPDRASRFQRLVGGRRVAECIARDPGRQGALRRLSERGLLEIDDADEAATHFSALVTNVVGLRSLFGAIDLPADEVDALVESGVRAFLRLYGRRPGPAA